MTRIVSIPFAFSGNAPFPWVICNGELEAPWSSGFRGIKYISLSYLFFSSSQELSTHPLETIWSSKAEQTKLSAARTLVAFENIILDSETNFTTVDSQLLAHFELDYLNLVATSYSTFLPWFFNSTNQHRVSLSRLQHSSRALQHSSCHFCACHSDSQSCISSTLSIFWRL